MTAAERAEIIVTARLLDAAKSLDQLSTGLSLISAAIILLGKPHRTAAIACIVCGIVAKFYSVLREKKGPDETDSDGCQHNAGDYR